MNKPTKILFATLFLVAALAFGNVIVRCPSDSVERLPEASESVDTTWVSDLLHTNIQKGSPLSKYASGFIYLERMAYILSYNPVTKLPVWVAWHLTADHTHGNFGRSGLKFVEDEDVPTPRAVNMDYYNSGYDRGHMCPSGDNKWSEKAQLQSFLYTNCCPQLHNLNSGDWSELEGRCRKWAVAYGDIYIVCGPLLLNKKHKTIGKNKVVVPEAFFKVVLRMKDGPKAIGFIYRNEAGNKKMSAYVNTVDEVERITGLDFFSALPDEIETKVEAVASLDDWE